jgi:hypothetical protein
MTSAPATLTVNQSTTATDPAAAAKCEGDSATFSTTASGTGPFSYQWKKGAVNIAGEIGSSYTIASVTSADAGSYSVRVTGTCGTVTTAGAALTINPLPTTSLRR